MRYKGLARVAYELKITPMLSPVVQRTDMTVAEKLDASSWMFDVKSVAVEKN